MELQTIEKTDVESVISEKLEAFSDIVANHEFLEIDGDIEGGTPDKHLIKVINHNTEEAHSVTVDAIVRQRPMSIVKALETGITIRLTGVTRIVGYYSRVQNWNKSKIAELADRHKGNYKLGNCKGLCD